MAYRRTTAPRKLYEGYELTTAMAAIGIGFAAESRGESDIEDTVVSASIEGLERDDLRVLAVLATWIDVHHHWLNADRLVRATRTLASERTRAFWTAVAQWKAGDRRLRRLAGLYEGARIELLRTGNEFQVKRRGEDQRFSETCLRAPAGVLRSRASDVLTPAQLAKHHRAYHYRVLIGPSYRADMWAALESDPTMTPTELARRTYGSFATAWQVKQDWQLLAA